MRIEIISHLPVRFERPYCLPSSKPGSKSALIDYTKISDNSSRRDDSSAPNYSVVQFHSANEFFAGTGLFMRFEYDKAKATRGFDLAIETHYYFLDRAALGEHFINLLLGSKK